MVPHARSFRRTRRPRRHLSVRSHQRRMKSFGSACVLNRTKTILSSLSPYLHEHRSRRRFVDQLDWLDATTFADLFSLGNALPGPGSTQLAFSIALVRNGTLAGLLAFALWS